MDINMNRELIKKIIEGAIFAAEAPMPLKQICYLFEKNNVETIEIQEALQEISSDYAERGIELKEVASGYRFQVCDDFIQIRSRPYPVVLPLIAVNGYGISKDILHKFRMGFIGIYEHLAHSRANVPFGVVPESAGCLTFKTIYRNRRFIISPDATCAETSNYYSQSCYAQRSQEI